MQFKNPFYHIHATGYNTINCSIKDIFGTYEKIHCKLYVQFAEPKKLNYRGNKKKSAHNRLQETDFSGSLLLAKCKTKLIVHFEILTWNRGATKMYLFSKLLGIGPTRRKLYRLWISKTESTIAMPFLALKMNSSLPNIKNTTARITKNDTFMQTIWTILRYNVVWKRISAPFRWV